VSSWQQSPLYPQKHIFPVHKVQERPLDHNVTDRHHDDVPRVANKMAQPSEQGFGGIAPIDKSPGHVDQNGVHSNDAKEKGPSPVSPYVDDIVEQRQQNKTPSPDVQYK